MFNNVKKSWQIGRMKGRVHIGLGKLEELQRTISVLGEEELAGIIAEEGISQFKEHYSTYAMWARHPHMVRKEQLDTLEEMQIESIKRLDIQLDMVKSQGLAYFEQIAGKEKD